MWTIKKMFLQKQTPPTPTDNKSIRRYKLNQIHPLSMGVSCALKENKVVLLRDVSHVIIQTSMVSFHWNLFLHLKKHTTNSSEIENNQSSTFVTTGNATDREKKAWESMCYIMLLKWIICVVIFVWHSWKRCQTNLWMLGCSLPVE